MTLRSISWIGNPPVGYLRESSQFVLVSTVDVVDIDDVAAACEELVGDDPPVAAPIYGFGADNRRHVGLGERD